MNLPILLLDKVTLPQEWIFLNEKELRCRIKKKSGSVDTTWGTCNAGVGKEKRSRAERNLWAKTAAHNEWKYI